MRPFLSVITINYNNCIGLEKTISSVMSQVFKDFEYLIIDGGSTDGSKEYIESQKELIHYYVSEPDEGIYNAMNKGIKHAQGIYLLFLNSGDVLDNESALFDFINHQDFKGDIIYGDYKFERGGKVYPDYLSPLNLFRASLPHQSSFIKKDLFEKYGFYDEKYSIVSDKAFYIKCLLSNQVMFKHIKYSLSLIDLFGVSNNLAHKEQLEKENEMMLKEYFGLFYGDYKKMVDMQFELNQMKKHTIKGIINRIKKKIISTGLKTRFFLFKY